MVGIIDGMIHIHELGYVHRDLRTENILLDQKIPKISDFGLTRKKDNNGIYKRPEKERLPIRWTSDQIINNSVCSEASDVWAFGITCIEIWNNGKLPFPNMSNVKVQNWITNKEKKEYPEEINTAPFFINIINKCLKGVGVNKEKNR